ncbi:endonuclease/exonuclease/phosphatase family protein [Rhizobium leguminosarum]|uniref:endonuclease/exonuclease/phosphatase family protein n=1 Tax=Rhizobium leguminosarum TaxID=384 RepID=UPI001C92225E|nr:endonuclease/exonuclease/phosphatase family protein [Rhizobium leguminosarum]MBY3180055.1 endonuclease/exonuclease/phosphatase family protein [Rhizobium leguminosarum]
MYRYFLAMALLLVLALDAQARVLTVSSWNLGWHMDLATANRWIELCNKRYVTDAAADVWREGSGPDSKPGWFVDAFKIQGWDTAQYPVCSVYRERDNDVVFVKPAGYEKRLAQLSKYIASSLPADILAFQEVNGEDSVREILPDNGTDYDFCAISGYKVQRIVIAWKRSLGQKVSCDIEDALSLPNNPPDKQPRPGLALSLSIDGVTLRVLSVHLKSRCVSPFDNGNLSGGGDHCPILQQQVGPLESWIERVTANDGKVILLGDFNRNFWHELRDPSPVRSDGGSPAAPHTPSSLTNSLIEDVFDGSPAASTMRMLEERCDTNAIGSLLCDVSEIRPLDPAERALLGSPNYLGCTNAVGLDHVFIGSGIKNPLPAEHRSIGKFGGSVAGSKPDGSDQLLSISDHCPTVALIEF